ncbi:Piso0_005485 [Millerozyma farinosa CBS 7064]|uniref:Piso0_005485 protein n=1 Tax=Pichia sorbitophila (strain ATCC MYA-4447 / BCRC 22081 / CBS 7064 / NBRC 10061 / NRRL Y-12695) TaxID=559304 RepID=G8Y581_PICSO|nr:Piso0_005485 [Millerozyma farinosa CBS 7064]
MTSKRTKTVPKNLTSRFAVSSSNVCMNRRSSAAAQCESFASDKLSSSSILFLTELPSLPSPSLELKNILLNFSSANHDFDNDEWDFFGLGLDSKGHKKTTSRRYKPKGRRTRSLNGFMAFRSFYSRSISNVEHQRQLSSLLGSLWQTEPNKNIWNRYAIEYNTRATNQDFVEWLCKALSLPLDVFSIPSTSTVKNNKWLFTSNNNYNAVEDVYYAI